MYTRCAGTESSSSGRRWTTPGIWYHLSMPQSVWVTGSTNEGTTTMTYRYAIKGDTLSLTFDPNGKGVITVTFNREGSKAAREAAAAQEQSK